MEVQPPDPGFFIHNFICIQREIFVNICAFFTENVNEKNKVLFQRAVDFSKDFNNCSTFNFENFTVNEENFRKFCDFHFDFMNYVRKIDNNLYEDSINFARNKLVFPTMPTLDAFVYGCSSSIVDFLNLRENGQLPTIGDSFESFEE